MLLDLAIARPRKHGDFRAAARQGWPKAIAHSESASAALRANFGLLELDLNRFGDDADVVSFRVVCTCDARRAPGWMTHQTQFFDGVKFFAE